MLSFGMAVNQKANEARPPERKLDIPVEIYVLNQEEVSRCVKTETSLIGCSMQSAK